MPLALTHKGDISAIFLSV